MQRNPATASIANNQVTKFSWSPLYLDLMYRLQHFKRTTNNSKSQFDTLINNIKLILSQINCTFTESSALSSEALTRIQKFISSCYAQLTELANNATIAIQTQTLIKVFNRLKKNSFYTSNISELHSFFITLDEMRVQKLIEGEALLKEVTNNFSLFPPNDQSLLVKYCSNLCATLQEFCLPDEQHNPMQPNEADFSSIIESLNQMGAASSRPRP